MYNTSGWSVAEGRPEEFIGESTASVAMETLITLEMSGPWMNRKEGGRCGMNLPEPEDKLCVL